MGYKLTSKNCVANKFPEIAKQWHSTKNGDLTPKNFSYGSDKIAWWICDFGHSFPCRIANRCVLGRSCPYCVGKKVSKENCLLTKRPGLAKEWDYNKNKRLTPEKVTAFSSKIVYWKCSSGHSYPCKIANRSALGRGCPFCAGRKVSDENRLFIKYPDLKKEWDYNKNKKLDPEEISFGSSRNVWWICSDKKHSYSQTINTRTNLGIGCPYCFGHKVCIDNCLATLYPHLVAEWHPTKNGKLTPYNVRSGSIKKVRWKCKINPTHEWQSTIASRALLGTNCPYCSKILLKDGEYFDSVVEAIKYIEYKEKGLIFKHNKLYHKDFGKFRYDFFFQEENKYVEVTGYSKKSIKKHSGFYFHYLRNIVKKRRFVENVFKAKFEFIQLIKPTKEQFKKLREWIK